jgi:ABC-2 type transport system permease protein
MTTMQKLDHEAVLAARQALVPVTSRGWLGGFANMLDKELGEWFRTRRWLVHAIIWLAIINGITALILFALPKSGPGTENTPPIGVVGLSTFFSLAVQAGAIGMIIIAQDEIIREKQTGTAAWILSKPVSRQAFILTKLLANLVGSTVFILMIPALVGYGEFALANTFAQLGPYLQGELVVFLSLLFYLTLTLMLGVLFESRAAVLGIAFGVMFGSSLLVQLVAQLAYILPVNLSNIAVGLALGQPMPEFALTQVAMSAVWSVLFAVIAVWRFLKEEF